MTIRIIVVVVAYTLHSNSLQSFFSSDHSLHLLLDLDLLVVPAGSRCGRVALQAGKLDGSAALGTGAAGGGRQGVVLLEVGLRRKHVPALCAHVFTLEFKELGCARADDRASHTKEVAHVARPGYVVTCQLGAHRETWEGRQDRGKKGWKNRGRGKRRYEGKQEHLGTRGEAGRCSGSINRESKS